MAKNTSVKTTKTDLVKLIAEKSGSTLDAANTTLNTVLDCITESLKASDVLAIMGFGTFSKTIVEAHDGKNPRNPDEMIHIPERARVSFSSGAYLKKAINNEDEPVKKTVKKADTKTSGKKAVVAKKKVIKKK